jgi:hypothetical protein
MPLTLLEEGEGEQVIPVDPGLASDTDDAGVANSF